MYKRSLTLLFSFLAVALLVGACGGGGEPASQSASAPAAAPKAASASTGSATITGKVAYSNGDPDQPIRMDADPVCSGLHEHGAETEQIVGGEGVLGNVFIYVKSGLSGSYPVPAENKLLEQKGCQYFPHVSGIQVGQTLVIRNDDPTLHNVHALPQKNQEFNQGQPFQGMELERTFDQPEVMVRFKCDVHPWMSSYAGVLDHPFYAVSAEDGTFSIGHVPAGTYTLEAWHETLGTQTMEVTVEDGATIEADWQFGE
jgi:plastocyanin